MHSNGCGIRNVNKRNNGKEKKKKHNDPFIPKEVCNKMAPEVTKSHIEASKKGRLDQQSYVIQYSGKGLANDKKNQHRNQHMGGKTQ